MRTMGSLAKNTVPSGNGVDVAGEAQARELVDELGREAILARKPLQLFGARNARPSRNSTTCSRPAARKKLRCLGGSRRKNSSNTARVGHAMLVVRLEHGELIQVGQQGAGAGIAGMRGFHRRRFSGSELSAGS